MRRMLSLVPVNADGGVVERRVEECLRPGTTVMVAGLTRGLARSNITLTGATR